VTRRRILFVQPSMQPPGGGNVVAAWVLHALHRIHDVRLFTWVPVDLDEVNRFAGTSIRRSEISVETIPAALRHAVDSCPFRFALLRNALMMRWAQQRASHVDVPLTINNELDFGVPGIQYVHYPMLNRLRPEADLRWYHRLPFTLDAYYALAHGLSGLSVSRIQQNVTLANSHWTGRRYADRYGVMPRILYPPVASRFTDVSWQERENAFVCVGRIASEKRLEVIISILARVRRHHPDVRLHIVGSFERSHYSRRMRRLAAASADWIQIHEHISRPELTQLLPRIRYGIHGALEEHFGMAPAEMLSAGCIVFVPSGGGQVEIVDNDPRLVYTSEDDAVASILAVLGNDTLQADLRQQLAVRRQLFRLDHFMAAIRELVDTFDPTRSGGDPRPATYRPVERNRGADIAAGIRAVRSNARDTPASASDAPMFPRQPERETKDSGPAAPRTTPRPRRARREEPPAGRIRARY
jgi:glycosyltransferase involved in cell wall biosynthesis